MDELDLHLKQIYLSLIGTDRLYDEIAKRTNLSRYQMLILYHLDYSDDMTQSKLVEALYLPKQTVNSILLKWKEEGYLTFEFLENNKKEKKIVLTEAGNIFIKTSLKELKIIEKNVLKKMGSKNTLEYIKQNEMFRKCLKEELNNV